MWDFWVHSGCVFWDVRPLICGCISHIDSPLRCLWVYFHALVSGRISVGVYPTSLTLWSPWVCVPKDFQCLYLSGYIYQHVRSVTCLSVHVARLKVSGVIWVVFLRLSLWSFVCVCHMQVCHLFGWVCKRVYEVCFIWGYMSQFVRSLTCLCVYVGECGLFSALCVCTYPRVRGGLFVGPRMWVLLCGGLSQDVRFLFSLWVYVPESVWFSECEDSKN